jgi:hypothetical protein
MKTLFLLIFILLLGLFCVSAKIEIINIEEYYAIGDEIKPSIQITSDIDVLALLSLELICDEYSKLYFMQPLDLKDGNPVLVKIPSLKVFNKMLGTCILDVYIDSIIGAKLEKEWTDQFDILIERPIEDMHIDENSNITTEDITLEEPQEKEEPKEKTTKIWLYMMIFMILVVIGVYFYLKYKVSNKNAFNRGWKI